MQKHAKVTRKGRIITADEIAAQIVWLALDAPAALTGEDILMTGGATLVAPKFIGVWSHPRSMSTSIERCFRERGDCRCHHEPFMYYYYLERLGQPYPNFNPENQRPRRWQDIAGMLTTLPDTDEKPHIFFKDMSYYIDDLHDELADFMAATVSIFLIRDPRFTLASYHRLDPAFSLAEGGLRKPVAASCNTTAAQAAFHGDRGRDDQCRSGQCCQGHV